MLPLKSTCEQSLIITVTSESAIVILMLADLHNAADLKKSCIEYINIHAKELKKHADWSKLKINLDLLMELYEHISNN